MKHPAVKAIVRGAVISLAIAVIPLLVLVLVPLLNGQYIAPSALGHFTIVSLAFGVLVYLCGLFTKRLQKSVGRLTGYAALAGGTALVGTALALMLPECPGNTDGASCTVPDAASWGLSLSLLVILISMIWVGMTGLVRLSRTGWSKVQDHREAAAEAEKQAEIERLREQNKDRAPHEPKNYPTPKRKQRKKSKNKNNK